MKNTLAVAAAAFVSAIALSSDLAPALAQTNEVCLRNERIWSWNVVNPRTMIVRDVTNRPFLVQLGAGCVGLNNTIGSVAFNTKTNLGCVRRGDRVSFHEPALGGMSCFIRDVQPVVEGGQAPAAEPPRN